MQRWIALSLISFSSWNSQCLFIFPCFMGSSLCKTTKLHEIGSRLDHETYGKVYLVFCPMVTQTGSIMNYFLFPLRWELGIKVCKYGPQHRALKQDSLFNGEMTCLKAWCLRGSIISRLPSVICYSVLLVSSFQSSGPALIWWFDKVSHKQSICLFWIHQLRIQIW